MTATAPPTGIPGPGLTAQFAPGRARLGVGVLAVAALAYVVFWLILRVLAIAVALLVSPVVVIGHLWQAVRYGWPFGQVPRRPTSGSGD